MLFSSLEFILIFLPLVALGFFALGRLGNRQLAIGWLVAASLIFYAYWKPPYLVLLMASMAGNFAVGKWLDRTTGTTPKRKALLVAGIAANLLLLGYYKYSNFVVESLGNLAGTNWEMEKIFLPLAISFFTFQQIAFLVDQYRGNDIQYSFLDYCLFVTFFPQLIAGPIVHHKAVLPQFSDPKTFKPQDENLAVGLTIFILGLFKKIVIADHAADFANPVFEITAGGGMPTWAEAWTGALAYSFQLYFDFSGYSDMAIGLGRMFGIALPMNFNSPYKATSIVDFWRRWHITLSVFLRDYLYIPLGGNRHGPVRRYVNLFLTMLLGGLWHGAGWTYILWGALHGFYLCVNHAWISLRKKVGWSPTYNPWWWRTLACAFTFFAVLIGWVIFRSENISSAITILEVMSGLHGFELATSFKAGETAGILLLIGGLTWLCPNTQQLMAQFRPVYDWDRAQHELAPLSWHQSWMAWTPSTTRAVLLTGAMLVVFLNMNRVQEFLYFQF